VTESLLLGLIELLAISTKFQKDRERVDSVVRFFLRSQLEVVKINKYLTIFDNHYKAAIKNTKPGDDFWASEAGRLLTVGAQLNKELTQEQKINILFTLFSAVESGRSVTEIELNFLKTLSDVFYLDEDVFFTALSFSILELESDPSERGCVVAFTGSSSEFSRESIIVIPGLNGTIGVLEMDKQGLYYIKYTGEHSLMINDVKMMENVIYSFDNGEIIRIIGAEPLYYTDVFTKLADDQGKLAFDVNKISYLFPNGKTGIHEMSFSETSGRLVGIMGSSGAGKSTLIEVLNGNRKPASGQVTINGIDIHREREKVEGVVGYVPQDDLLIEDLTTFQNLYYAAKLSFKDMSDEDAAKLVREVITDLGLVDAMDLKVGNPLEKSLSGGQRKRLNIGLELLRAPSVLFLDEPTSGLSTSDSENIMDLLKELAENGKLIFVVIHQPSADVFKLFDRLLIMDTGGYFIYYGNPLDAITYFKNKTNSLNKDSVYDHGHLDPDIIFELIEQKTLTKKGEYTTKRKVEPAEWYQEFRKSKKYIHIKKEPTGGILNSIEPARWAEQLRIFFLRDMMSKLSNLQYLFINVLQAPALAFLLATLNRYYEIDTTYTFSGNSNMPIFLFMSVIVSLFLGLTVSAEEIVHDRKIIKRERFLNLSRSSYLLSKVAILFFVSAFQMLAYWLISCYVLGINEFSFIHYFTLFSTTAFANMLGLNISSMFNRAITVYILIPIILIPQLILSGVVLPFDRINPDVKERLVVPLVSETMASRWAYEGLMVSFFKDNKYNSYLYDLHYKRIENEMEFIYRLPILESKLDNALLKHDSKDSSVLRKVAEDLRVVKNELKGYSRRDAIVPGCTEFIMSDAISYINKERERRMQLSGKFVDEESAMHRKLDRLYGEGRLNYLRETSHNEEIASKVRNLDEEKKIVETNGHLKILAEPVYTEPDGNKVFTRTRLFAPHKYFLGLRLSTPVFNVLVLWLMTFLLYGMLYFNVLRWFIKLFEKIKKKKKR